MIIQRTGYGAPIFGMALVGSAAAGTVWLWRAEYTIGALLLGCLVVFLGLPMLQFRDRLELSGDELTSRKLWTRGHVVHPLRELIQVEMRLFPPLGDEPARHASFNLMFADGSHLYVGPDFPIAEVATIVERAMQVADGAGWPLALGDAILVGWFRAPQPEFGTQAAYLLPMAESPELQQAFTVYLYESPAPTIEEELEEVVAAVLEHGVASPWGPMVERGRRLVGEGASAMQAVDFGPAEDGAPLTSQVLLARRGGGRLLKVRCTTGLDADAHAAAVDPVVEALIESPLR